MDGGGDESSCGRVVDGDGSGVSWDEFVVDEEAGGLGVGFAVGEGDFDGEGGGGGHVVVLFFPFSSFFGLLGGCRRDYIFFSNSCPGREQKKKSRVRPVCLAVL